LLSVCPCQTLFLVHLIPHYRRHFKRFVQVRACVCAALGVNADHRQNAINIGATLCTLKFTIRNE
jgi:hypothetical protein